VVPRGGIEFLIRGSAGRGTTLGTARALEDAEWQPNRQHEDAPRLLRLISRSLETGRRLNYTTAAIALGRPAKDARAVAQICDLLDAAAALAGVPLLALVKVEQKVGE
jgi:hypothetical protein